ncbi:MAG: hypothetical protein M1818_006453 [Claussenomyces sp. TS43310]|nr:MAG: hypothetical protein M1818_006453 [Claussenomyces sp. TS43310]
MCGRYSLALRPSQVRAYLENEDMPVFEAPDDEGDHAPRQSYNFAPGYHGIVYRADVPDWGAGPRMQEHGEEEQRETSNTEDAEPNEDMEVRYKLQSMKWGLIPFWTKRNPDYSSMMKTINCRDDSLIESRGMWNTMKQKKRCIVIAQGFYEWLKKPYSREKIPHYTKRKDGQLLCMAGLWDCVQYEGAAEKLYTYTIITTSSNKQLGFLHDRMPVILENGSEDIRKWLDPKRNSWSGELQSLLKPYEGELEIYPVSKEVGKVGNNSPTFIVPVDSAENKNNIANFFSQPKGSNPKSTTTATPKKESPEPKNIPIVKTEALDESQSKRQSRENRKTIDHNGTEDNAPLPVPETFPSQGSKRAYIDDVPGSETHASEAAMKEAKISHDGSPAKTRTAPTRKSARKPKSATSNGTISRPTEVEKDKGSRKITSFFAK